MNFRDIQAARKEREKGFEEFQDTFRAVLVAVDFLNSAKVNREPGMRWFQELEQHQDATPGKAFAKGVPDLVGLKVIVKRHPKRPFSYKIIDWDEEQIRQLPGFSETVLMERHAQEHIDGFDQLVLPTRNLGALRCYITPDSTSLTVNIAPYKNFAGYNDYSLASSQPASGLARYVLVYLRTSDWTIQTVDGATATDLDTVPPVKPDVPDGGIASAYVRLDGDQAAIAKEDIVEGREFLNVEGGTGGGVYPPPNKVMLWDVSASTAVEYDDLATALGVVETGDALVLGIGDFDLGAAQIANTVPLTIIGSGDRGSTITSSHATEIIHPSADLTIINCYIDAPGGGDGFTIDGVDVEIINCQYEIASGPGINGVNIGASSAANVTIKYSRIVVGGGTSIAVANNSSNLYIYAGYFGGGAAISHTDTPNIELYDTPTLVGTVSSLTEGVYIDASGNVILGPDAYIDFEERAAKPTVGTGRWGLYSKSDGFYQVDDAGVETSLAQSGGSGVGANALYHTVSHDVYQEFTSKTNVTNDSYVGDVWNVLHSAATTGPTWTRQAGLSSDPFPYYMRLQAKDAGGTRMGYVQFLSAADTAKYRGQTVSISADLWGSGVSNIQMMLAEWGSTGDALTSDIVGTWGATPTLATDWAFSDTPGTAIAIDGTRTRYAVEGVTVGSTVQNLALFVWTPDIEAADDYFNIAQVKVEIGATATDFVARSYQDELFGINYFFEVLGGDNAFEFFGTGAAVSTTTAQPIVQFQRKIAVPSFSVSADTDFALTDVSGSTLSVTSLSFVVPSKNTVVAGPSVASGLVAGNASSFLADNTTNARIYIDARL